MAFPVIPVLLGGGVLALILFSRKSEAQNTPIQPGPTPGPIPPAPRPIPPPLRGPQFRIDSAQPGFTETALYSRPEDNANIVKILGKGVFVSIPNSNQNLGPTPGSPEGWFLAVSDGTQGYVKAEYLIGPVNVVAGVSVGRNGGGHGGGTRGGGFRGGHGGRFSRGFNRSVISTTDFAFPWWGYGYPTYPYANYDLYSSYAGYGNPLTRNAYNEWQAAMRSGASPEVVARLKARFETFLYSV